MIGLRLRRRHADQATTAKTDAVSASVGATVALLSLAPRSAPQSPSESGNLPVDHSKDSHNRHGQKGSSVKQHGRRKRGLQLGSVQQLYVAAEAVDRNILILTTPMSARHSTVHREYRAILEVSSVNYALKTEGEQEAILAGYRAFLNGLGFPIQILVHIRILDLTPYLSELRVAREQALHQRDVRIDDHTHVALRAPVWAQLAEDEDRYVRELATQKTLLERHFYVVVPGEDTPGQTESSLSGGAGLQFARVGSPLYGWFPVPGRRRRRVRAAARDLQRAEKQLALRTSAIARELERLGLETRRLPDNELAAIYQRMIAPDVAARSPLPDAVLAGTGLLPMAAVHTRGSPSDVITERSLLAGESGSTALAAAPCDATSSTIPQLSQLSQLSLEMFPLSASNSDSCAQGILENHAGAVATRAAHTRAAPDDLSQFDDAPSDGVVAHGADDDGRDRDARAVGSSGDDDVTSLGFGPFGDLADVLAPASVSLTRDDVRLDDTFCHTLAVVGYPRHVYPGWLERLIDLDEPLDVVLHIHPQSTAAMIRQLSHRLVQLHSSRLLDEERHRIGHAELGVAYRDVERMREHLQRGDERVFATSFYLHVRASVAPSPGGARRYLDERVARVETELANQQLVARPATFEQDLALLSCLPEGRDRLLRTRLLDTSSLATAFPFLSNSLSMRGGILIGTTANGSPVFIDAFAPELENANKVVFAKSGAGKSYACKIEALRSLLRGTDVYVVDPEAEYEPLASAVGGQTVRLAAGAQQHLNPFDLPTANERDVAPEAGVGGDVLAEKVQSLHALLDLMLADRGPTGTAGLSQREKGLLDRALYEVYRRAGITSDPATHRRPAPLLRDLYDVLVGGNCGVDESHLADRLHRYVHGSLSRLFAEPTNVELADRLVVFDVRDMDAELRPLGLFLIAEFVWTRIRRERRPRLLVIDEAWTLMQYQEGGRFLAGLARRARKYYLGLITITQDAQDFLSSEHGRTVLANSSVQLLMKQDSSTIDAVSKTFRLSTGERQYLLGCHKGEGLLFARGGHVALQIGASPFEHELATTDPRELAIRQERSGMRHRNDQGTRALAMEGARSAEVGNTRKQGKEPGPSSRRRGRSPKAQVQARPARDALNAVSVETTADQGASVETAEPKPEAVAHEKRLGDGLPEDHPQPRSRVRRNHEPTEATVSEGETL